MKHVLFVVMMLVIGVGVVYGIPPKSEAKRIVYVVDFSEAVGEELEGLKSELLRSILNMIPVQPFDVVMVSDKAEAMHGELKRASAEVKKEAKEKIAAMKLKGKNDGKLEPFKEGFEKAFAMQPDRIYFLTVSSFDPELVAAVKQLNEKKKVRVNALGWVKEDEGRDELLRTMAEENGGKFKHVTKADLEKK
ncbi:MAG: hypothetical protein FWD53_09260 [Phycisphaerales bacterium]|nr:hypothetical protein [Phycisphaerales bacterium]